jgi:2-polyprenyl-6-methoxyphenol hydroxylase-like FAD-dependent oxidoreductase
VPKVQISPGSSVAIIGAGVVGMASACVLNRKVTKLLYLILIILEKVDHQKQMQAILELLIFFL